MKFCKDCRFYSVSYGDAFCRSPSAASISPVSGPLPRYAVDARQYPSLCGPEAKHYEPRLSLFQKIKRKLAA